MSSKHMDKLKKNKNAIDPIVKKNLLELKNANKTIIDKNDNNDNNNMDTNSQTSSNNSLSSSDESCECFVDEEYDKNNIGSIACFKELFIACEEDRIINSPFIPYNVKIAFLKNKTESKHNILLYCMEISEEYNVVFQLLADVLDHFVPQSNGLSEVLLKKFEASLANLESDSDNIKKTDIPSGAQELIALNAQKNTHKSFNSQMLNRLTKKIQHYLRNFIFSDRFFQWSLMNSINRKNGKVKNIKLCDHKTSIFVVMAIECLKDIFSTLNENVIDEFRAQFAQQANKLYDLNNQNININDYKNTFDEKKIFTLKDFDDKNIDSDDDDDDEENEFNDIGFDDEMYEKKNNIEDLAITKIPLNYEIDKTNIKNMASDIIITEVLSDIKINSQSDDNIIITELESKLETANVNENNSDDKISITNNNNELLNKISESEDDDDDETISISENLFLFEKQDQYFNPLINRN